MQAENSETSSATSNTKFPFLEWQDNDQPEINQEIRNNHLRQNHSDKNNLNIISQSFEEDSGKNILKDKIVDSDYFEKPDSQTASEIETRVLNKQTPESVKSEEPNSFSKNTNYGTTCFDVNAVHVNEDKFPASHCDKITQVFENDPNIPRNESFIKKSDSQISTVSRVHGTNEEESQSANFDNTNGIKGSDDDVSDMKNANGLLHTNSQHLNADSSNGSDSVLTNHSNNFHLLVSDSLKHSDSTRSCKLGSDSQTSQTTNKVHTNTSTNKKDARILSANQSDQTRTDVLVYLDTFQDTRTGINQIFTAFTETNTRTKVYPQSSNLSGVSTQTSETKSKSFNICNDSISQKDGEKYMNNFEEINGTYIGPKNLEDRQLITGVKDETDILLLNQERVYESINSDIKTHLVTDKQNETPEEYDGQAVIKVMIL